MRMFWVDKFAQTCHEASGWQQLTADPSANCGGRPPALAHAFLRFIYFPLGILSSMCVLIQYTYALMYTAHLAMSLYKLIIYICPKI